ncbi:hypothetical protein EB796_021679 [Bugula neritina]|uniref:Uncharacterized protein n=1 Tax=Bugula neritina TaxID=10212 RepID=A0A7J7J1H4_BUGNE|nr:hypothetical protein EB796_021679 [Bugula neritina]
MLLDLVQGSQPSRLCDMSNHDVETGKLVEEFAKAGRTGRRNALPDVLSLAHASCGTEDLTQALQQLQTTSTNSGAAGSNIPVQGAAESGQAKK